jgi:hypothetical protein
MPTTEANQPLFIDDINLSLQIAASKPKSITGRAQQRFVSQMLDTVLAGGVAA